MTAGTAEPLEDRLMGRFAGRLAARVQTPSSPGAAQVVSWLDLVDLCRELDDALVAADPPSAEALALHQAVVSLAIGCGSWLLHQVRVQVADISASGQTMETLEASLELVRILQRARHSSFPPAELEAVRQRIFNTAA